MFDADWNAIPYKPPRRAQVPLKKPASRPKKPSKPKMKPAPRTGSGKAHKRW